jgi:hypothetical protein
MIRVALVMLFYCLWLTSHAQFVHSGGLFEVAGSTTLAKGWSTTAKLASLHRATEGLSSPSIAYQHIQTDLQLFAGYQLTSRWETALGYHILAIPSGIAHRMIQQLSFVQKGRRSKTGHRFRFDQTYQNEATPGYRLRYRFSWEKPLSGFSLDPGEYYFLFSTEPMPRFRRGRLDAEHRLGVSLGKRLLKAGKIECGLDYRTRNILTQLNHRCLIRLGAYLKL